MWQHNKIFYRKKGNSIGLYCEQCGKWNKWLNKNEARLFELKQEVIKDKVVCEKDYRPQVEELIKCERTLVTLVVGGSED